MIFITIINGTDLRIRRFLYT